MSLFQIMTGAGVVAVGVYALSRDNYYSGMFRWLYQDLKQSTRPRKYYEFDPHRAPPQFTDADLEEHTLYNPDREVTTEDIRRINKKVQETGERLPRGEDRQMMMAHLHQANKRLENEEWKKNANGLLALCAYGPTCWNASTEYGDKYNVCWDCGQRHM